MVNGHVMYDAQYKCSYFLHNKSVNTKTLCSLIDCKSGCTKTYTYTLVRKNFIQRKTMSTRP